MEKNIRNSIRALLVALSLLSPQLSSAYKGHHFDRRPESEICAAAFALLCSNCRQAHIAAPKYDEKLHQIAQQGAVSYMKTGTCDVETPDGSWSVERRKISYSDYPDLALEIVKDATSPLPVGYGASRGRDGNLYVVMIMGEDFDSITEAVSASVKKYTASELQSMRREIFRLVNAHRSEYGLRALKWDDRIASVAAENDRLQIKNNACGHFNFNNRSDKVETLTGYRNGVLENAAYGCESAREFVEGWIASRGHHENILNCDVEYTGVSVTPNARGQMFSTQMFASERPLGGHPTWHAERTWQSPKDLSELSSSIERLLNEARRQHGLPALQHLEALYRAAQAQSSAAAQRGKFLEHIPDWSARELAARKSIGRGPATVQVVKHRKTPLASLDTAFVNCQMRNILNREYVLSNATHQAVGVSRDAKGSLYVTWVLYATVEEDKKSSTGTPH